MKTTWALIMFLLLGPLSSQAVQSEAHPKAVPDHAVVFMYHHVSDTAPASTSVTPALFQEHLDYLADSGFRVWPLEKVVDRLLAGASLPDSVIAITFDDGYRSVYEEAFPRLRERGWPFTVFVSTDAIDQGAGPVMSWAQLKEMADAGATIASHGQKHNHLQRLNPGETRPEWRQRTLDELRHSGQRIEQETGQKPKMVAYPYGEFDDQLQAVVRQLGWIGFGQQSGAIGPLSDTTGLPRFPMAAGFAAMASFPEKAASLPLPVGKVETSDLMLKFGQESVILGAAAPVLRLTLASGDYLADQLQGFAGGQGRAEVRWVDRTQGIVEVQAPGDIAAGRSRYNITAPDRDRKRWYWYSHTWIAGERHQD
jgi:biofilm PGA synthesis lipoprotein PgaB